MPRVSTTSVLLNALLLFATRCANGAPAAASSAASSVAAVVPSSAAAAPAASPTVAFAKDDPNGILWTDDSDMQPEAIRGTLGASVIGPQNVPIDLENADFLAPPSTDSRTVYVALYLLVVISA